MYEIILLFTIYVISGLTMANMVTLNQGLILIIIAMVLLVAIAYHESRKGVKRNGFTICDRRFK